MPRVVRPGISGSFDETGSAAAQRIAEIDAETRGSPLGKIVERIFRVGVASSRAGTPIAMPANETVIRIPPISECEAVPSWEIQRGDRLLTIPERESPNGSYITVQDIEIQRMKGTLINVVVLARNQFGVDIRMHLEPGTIVRRF